MDTRHSPNNSPDAKETPPYGLDTDSILEAEVEAESAQDEGDAESEQVEYTEQAPQETYSEPNYALPPMPPVEEESQQPSEGTDQPVPPGDAAPRHRHGDKLVTPRPQAPVPTYTPYPAQPPPQVPIPAQQVPNALHTTAQVAALPGYVPQPASTTYGGQAYPQAPAPQSQPQQYLQEPQPQTQLQPQQVDYQVYPQQEAYQGVQVEPYSSYQASPITRNLRSARRELPQWAWAGVGAAGLLVVVLAVWLFLLRPGPATIVGKWNQSAAIPTATSTGDNISDFYHSIVDRAICGYANSIEFAQDGKFSAESIFGAARPKYEITNGKSLMISAAEGEYLWTFNLSGDSLTLQGPTGCIEGHYARVK